MKKLGIFLVVILGLSIQQGYGQFTQSIIGQLVDKESKAPLQGAILKVLGTDPLLTATTDADGKFMIKDVKYGKYDIEITFIGYETLVLPQVTVGAAKETNLNIDLTETINNLKEATIVAKQDKDKPINDMSTVSVRTFSVEETQRYSASFNDPARMSLSFAGISTSNDASNEIIVRGNSSRGLSWRIEGIEIPNPNHFSSGEGSTGGGISILSSQVLDNSDFMTGAFTADYGNALSGVFDIKFRKGNYKKRHYAFQFGVLGAQVMLEGPFSKKYDGSYLVNYRYSTLQLFNLLGLPIVDNGQVPVFQDLSFNFNFPMKKAGMLSFWGIGGNNTAGEIAVKDSTQWAERRERFQDNRISWVAATGLNYTYGFKNNKTYLKNIISFSYENNAYGLDSLDNNYVLQKAYSEKYIYYALRTHTFVTHKFNARHTVKAGVYYSHLFFDIFSEGLRFDINKVAIFFDDRGNGGMLQGYFNWKYRITEKVEMVTGMHALFFLFNSSYNIEPRWAIKYKFLPRHSVSLGTGIHSRVEPISTYMSRVQIDSVNYIQPNKNLSLSKAFHVVAGYDWSFAENFRLKTEVYFQYLYNVPVATDSGSILSALNLSSGYTDHTFINRGLGRNYGFEVTVEKFLSKNYFFLFTASVFNSEYTMGDDVWRSTRYNGNYMFNWLGGYEIKFGKKKVNSISINTRVIWRGGNRYIPIDLVASQAQGRQVEVSGDAYTQKLPDYFRWDASVLVKFNFNKWAFGISLDVQNVINRKNINSYYFDPYINNIRTAYMFGIMPVFNFKFEF
jgi:hypothetical protein